MLAPHPDDGVLGCGGVLARLASTNREILVIGISDGGASHPQSRTWTLQTSTEARRNESAAGLQMLGVDTPSLRLGYDDGSESVAIEHGATMRCVDARNVGRARALGADYRELDGHRHVRGANLGVAAQAYRDVGGFAPLQSARTSRWSRRWNATAGASPGAPRVVTSARRRSRASGGFGGFLLGLYGAETALA